MCLIFYPTHPHLLYLINIRLAVGFFNPPPILVIPYLIKLAVSFFAFHPHSSSLLVSVTVILQTTKDGKDVGTPMRTCKKDIPRRKYNRQGKTVPKQTTTKGSCGGGGGEDIAESPD